MLNDTGPAQRPHVLQLRDAQPMAGAMSDMEIIAEIGQNHNGDMDLAATLIRERKSRRRVRSRNSRSIDARALFPREAERMVRLQLQDRAQSRPMSTRSPEECEKAGIEFMASVFDVERIAWLEASACAATRSPRVRSRDRALIRRVGSDGKAPDRRAGHVGRAAFSATSPRCRCSRLPLLRLEVSDAIGRPEHLASWIFGRYAGFSDIRSASTAAMAACAGAHIVEKHFTLDKGMHGPDHACSMTPGELESRLHGFRRTASCI